jgi:hypothetical protein
MIVRKVRGKEALMPVVITAAEYALIKRIGVDPVDYVMIGIRKIAKKRRWTWWLERHPK